MTNKRRLSNAYTFLAIALSQLEKYDDAAHNSTVEILRETIRELKTEIEALQHD